MPTALPRPFTGEEFLDSLRGGREIWVYGERVKDVTTHPAFRNPARMLARLYDALHEPATRDRKSTRLNSSHTVISYAVFCLKKKRKGKLREIYQKHTLDDEEI